jgi:hypothetical protein
MPDPYSRSVEIPVKLVSVNADVEIPSNEPLTAIPTAKLALLKKIHDAAAVVAKRYGEITTPGRPYDSKSEESLRNLKTSLQELLDQYSKDWESAR